MQCVDLHIEAEDMDTVACAEQTELFRDGRRSYGLLTKVKYSTFETRH